MKIENRKYSLKTYSKKLLADTLTPVSVYLRLRDKFPNSLLLESSDYHANDNSFSYICFNPIASIKVENEIIFQQFPDGKSSIIDLKSPPSKGDLGGCSHNVPTILDEFASSFSSDLSSEALAKGEESKFKFINNGLFGFMAFDAVRYFEDIELQKK